MVKQGSAPAFLFRILYTLPSAKLSFTALLLQWFQQHQRPLPWKGEKDPYLIWLSEIILQQTRVEQGRPYFLRFKKAYPTVHDLARAPIEEVLKHWEGLGYYSRARNLHTSAQRISRDMKGAFPNTYEKILELKGVGPYTAAAIASFAFNLPHAVLDGNVFRVLSRFFGVRTPIDSSAGKKEFQQLAQALIPHDRPADFNQAIMDFGATQCTPAQPKCTGCPLAAHCQAAQQNLQAELPIKSKKLKKRDRFFHYFLFQHNDQIWIRQRLQQDVWQQLFDFPMVEHPSLIHDWTKALAGSPYHPPAHSAEAQLLRTSKVFRQTLSHQQIHALFFEVQVNPDFLLEDPGLQQINRKNLLNFAKPRIVDLYLSDNSLILDLR